MLRAEAIKLRFFEPRDIDLIAPLRSSAEAYDYFYEYDPYSREHQLQWWQNASLKQNEKNFVIAATDSDEAVGTIALVDIDMRNRKAEIGRIMIDGAHRSKGYGRVALALLAEYAFGHLNLRKLYLEVFSSNTKALALYEQAGFLKEGELKSHIYKNGDYRDITVMALFKEDV